jgi:hypothetical protein
MLFIIDNLFMTFLFNKVGINLYLVIANKILTNLIKMWNVMPNIILGLPYTTFFLTHLWSINHKCIHSN